MTPLQQKIGSLERSPETKPLSRINRWFLATTYSLARVLVTVVYVFMVVGLGNSNDTRPFALLATTAAYAILMLLLWLHERFPPRL